MKKANFSENSVQFSLNELFQIEENRRKEEIRKAKERAEAEARARAEAEAEARRLEVERAAKRAAEEAAEEARREAEAMLARERALLEAEREREALAAPVIPARRRSSVATVTGIAAMILSVVGLGLTAHFALQPSGPAVNIIERPVSIVATEEIYIPDLKPVERKDLTEIASHSTSSTRAGAKQAGKTANTKASNTKTEPKDKVVTVKDCGNDPLCGVDLDF